MTETIAPASRNDEGTGDPLRDALIVAVGDDYEIVRLIGRGGMGAVYLARDRALERLVAIKVLPPGTATDSGVLERFRREAKTVASLQHVGIVPLYSFGERRGLCWFVMGYVRGESLASRLERERMLDVDTARTLLAQIAEALDYAHRQGVVHRDIKPDNILLDDTSGRAMLTDFGIARADTLSTGTGLTQVGAVMGTPHYMSPEQATAEPGIDGRSDLYSTGVVGYQMLSGRLPFEGGSFRELLMQHISVTPEPLAKCVPNVPAELADAVMRCLEKEPARRFADGRGLRAAIGGDASDDETLTYELAELRHAAAWLVVTCVVAVIVAATAAASGGRVLGAPWWLWLMSPLLIAIYGVQVREARQRGYEFATIVRVVTIPPRWWWLWWPRRWRRSSDVYERLPRTLRTARALSAGAMALTLVELPLLTWAGNAQRYSLLDRVPAAHAFVSVRWLAALDAFAVVLAVLAFVVILFGAFVASLSLAARVGKPVGLKSGDQRRLLYKPTDAMFWRDPRIRQVLIGRTVDAPPSTPEAFVSQILRVGGTFAPSVRAAGTDAATAARRLLEAIGVTDRTLLQLEKAAPREQLERLDAELLQLDAGHDTDLYPLLSEQRTALQRTRERMVHVSAQRDDAIGRLEAIWSLVRRISQVTDATAAKDDLLRLEELAGSAERDFPPRRSTTGAQRTTTSLLMLLAVGGATAMAQRDGGVRSDVRALLARGQADSVLAALRSSVDTTVEAIVLEGDAYAERGRRPNIFRRMVAMRASRAAYERAVARDSSRVDALESLAWIYRLVPGYLGGSSVRTQRLLDRLDRVSPYRGAVMHAYFDRLDGHAATGAARLRLLTASTPDSAAAWFALGDFAFAAHRSDEALTAWRRYRELMPADHTILFHLGSLAAESGVAMADGEVALRSYINETPIPGEPGLDQAWWRLGQVLEHQGRTAPARDAYRKSLTLYPRDTTVQKALRALETNSAR